MSSSNVPESWFLSNIRKIHYSNGFEMNHEYISKVMKDLLTIRDVNFHEHSQNLFVKDRYSTL